ncbi:MAG: MFS transporter [Alcaligenaceae bacterium]|nr:MFS transporter [Alcaligenaceae bacterium]
MIGAVISFSSLYLATLLLLLGTGLFNTYLGIRLTEAQVSELWVGSLIAVYYLGLVLGARNGHRLIGRVGHIRAYASSAAVVTVAVLAQALIDNLWVWVGLRFLAGLAMVTQFMVIENWLNEQTENTSRGKVFAFYMVFSGLGTVLGQFSLTLFPALDYQPLVFAAMCSALCLLPVALTRRLHPAIVEPAPLMPRYYLARVPVSLVVVFITGTLTGAFYGLGPVFAYKQNLSGDQVAMFVAVAVAAGLVSQWPMGWLADRMDRARLMRLNAIALVIISIPLWGWMVMPYWVLLVVSACFGVFQFTLYPIASAFANDNVEPERRVGLSAIVLMVYGLGACLGPLTAGAIMREINPDTFFVFVAACSGLLVLYVRPQRMTGAHLSQDAPTRFVPMTDMETAPVAPALDPRIDFETDISHQAPAAQATAVESSVADDTATPPQRG